jgi:hypothetical protein
MAYDLNQSCKQHAYRSESPDALIDRHRGGYGIIVQDGGSTAIEIAFCPWCGNLPRIGDPDPSALSSDDEQTA